MNIQILHSWIEDYLESKVTPKKFAECMSLTSVSIEKMILHGADTIYDVEVTQNRPDLMSAVGLAREASVILPRFGIDAKFSYKEKSIPGGNLPKPELSIINDPNLVGRILAVVMEVTIGDSPKKVTERLETSGIRSLNNVIDVTNYVMRDIGHPTHVFDYDKLISGKLIIREAKKGERIQTLDGKVHTLAGGDIVADNGRGEIIDLLGIMGTNNSVVNESTKRILFFIDSVDPVRIRRSSMNLGIRSEAAVLNEKGVDPELARSAMALGIELFTEIAQAKQISSVIDIYQEKNKPQSIQVSKEKINTVIGVSVPTDIIEKSLPGLGFAVSKEEDEIFTVIPPSWRRKDITIREDVIEEVARIYGYHNLPNVLPPVTSNDPYRMDENPFRWEQTVKNFLKYTGFTEVYTYSMVSEDLFEGPLDTAITIQNELSDDRKYMRRTLIPSLLEVLNTNSTRERIRIFEMAKVYEKKKNSLPEEILTLALVMKGDVTFLEAKGIIEAIFAECGISDFSFDSKSSGGEGADILLKGKRAGEIEIFDTDIINIEMDFEEIVQEANTKKVYKPISKFTPVIEDVRLTLTGEITFEQISSFIESFHTSIKKVELIDTYNDKKTFRITYHLQERQLSNEDVTPIREKLYKALSKEFNAEIS